MPTRRFAAVAVLAALYFTCAVPSVAAVELLTPQERDFETSTTPGRWTSFTWPSTEFSGNFPALINGGLEFVSGNPVSIAVQTGAPAGRGSNSLRIFWDNPVALARNSHVGGVRITVPAVPGGTYTFSAFVRADLDVGPWDYGAGMSVDANGGTDPRQVTYGHKFAAQQLAPDLGQNIGDYFWSSTDSYNNELTWLTPSQFRCSAVAQSDAVTLYLWGLAKFEGRTDVRFDGVSIDGPMPSGPTPTPSPTPIPGSIPITGISQSSTQVGLYQPLTVAFDLGYSYSNPYDPSEIDVMFEFTGPSSVPRSIPAFWNGTTSRWEARIVPVETGQHTCRILADDSSGRSGEAVLDFMSVASAERGFIRRDTENPYHFRFDNGSPYHPVGHNVDWVVGDPNHWNYISRMADAGENWTRFWMASFVGTDIEWGAGVEAWAQGLGVYSPEQSDDFDVSLDQCRDRDVYAQMCLDSFTGWNYYLFDNWDVSPYNTANGGMCSIPLDYFSNAEAKRLAKQRYRYIVARWAAHTSVLCWELFNEIDALGAGGAWEETYHSNRTLGANWHQEMAQYINSIDPYDHLITTSFAYAPEQWSEVWNLPEIDIVEPHHYHVSVPRSHADLIAACRQYGKPVIMGEGGTDGAPGKPSATSLYSPVSSKISAVNFNDPGGSLLHSLVWTGAVCESGIMAWWWDSWIDPNNLYYRFQPVLAFVDGDDWSGLQMDTVSYLIVSGHTNVEVYGSAGPDGAMLWAKNWNSSTISGFRIRLPQVTADLVTAEFWNTTSGTPSSTQEFARTGGNMEITFPAFQWDTAVKIRATGAPVAGWRLY